MTGWLFPDYDDNGITSLNAIVYGKSEERRKRPVLSLKYQNKYV